MLSNLLYTSLLAVIASTIDFRRQAGLLLVIRIQNLALFYENMLSDSLGCYYIKIDGTGFSYY